MKIHQSLKDLAEKLTNPDNPIYVQADSDPKLLAVLANGLTEAANIIISTAQMIENKEASIKPDDIDDLADLATAFDESDDGRLHKLASVLDEILLTIGATEKDKLAFKLAEEKEIARLRAKYREEALDKSYNNVKKQHDEQNKVADAEKAIEEKVKNYRPLQHALSTRYSPDMPGVSLVRIGDNVYQCPVTKRIYNYDTGYTKMDGDKVPGTTVTNQTQLSERAIEHANFSTREEILNG